MKLTKSIASLVSTTTKKVAALLSPPAKAANSTHDVEWYNYSNMVVVKKSSDPLFWYSAHIGETFNIKVFDIDRYWVREPNEYGALNFIMKDDCEVYNSQEKEGEAT